MQQPKRILLIDEDFDHLLICSLFLQREGYEVRSMAGCEKMDDLIEMVGSFRPDLIFMDHDMRGICGMDLTKMLKSLEEFSGIHIIYFTDRSDIVKLANEAGADGYFRKPFDTNSLIGFTRRYLDR
jgi:DNA-binding response OmpR family regulator